MFSERIFSIFIRFWWILKIYRQQQWQILISRKLRIQSCLKLEYLKENIFTIPHLWRNKLQKMNIWRVVIHVSHSGYSNLKKRRQLIQFEELIHFEVKKNVDIQRQYTCFEPVLSDHSTLKVTLLAIAYKSHLSARDRLLANSPIELWTAGRVVWSSHACLLLLPPLPMPMLLFLGKQRSHAGSLFESSKFNYDCLLSN